MGEGEVILADFGKNRRLNASKPEPELSKLSEEELIKTAISRELALKELVDRKYNNLEFIEALGAAVRVSDLLTEDQQIHVSEKVQDIRATGH